MNKLIEIVLTYDLLFAYKKKVEYYDHLAKNEGDDKYIMSFVHHYNNHKKDKVEVFRTSKIKEPELKERIFALDQGYPIVHSCGNSEVIYSYLSEVKALSDKTVM